MSSWNASGGAQVAVVVDHQRQLRQRAAGRPEDHPAAFAGQERRVVARAGERRLPTLVGA